jgi:hypothetical protein
MGQEGYKASNAHQLNQRGHKPCTDLGAYMHNTSKNPEHTFRVDSSDANKLAISISRLTSAINHYCETIQKSRKSDLESLSNLSTWSNLLYSNAHVPHVETQRVECQQASAPGIFQGQKSQMMDTLHIEVLHAPSNQPGSMGSVPNVKNQWVVSPQAHLPGVHHKNQGHNPQKFNTCGQKLLHTPRPPTGIDGNHS